MSLSFKDNQQLDKVRDRVLAAMRCVDAITGSHIVSSIRVLAKNLRIINNRSGYFVLMPGPHFSDYGELESVSNGNFPQTQSYVLSIIDVTQQYLPQQVAITLPRSPLLEHDHDDSVFKALDIALYPAPNFRIRSSWCAVRISLRDQVDSEQYFYPGALVELVDDDDKVLAEGYSDERGEALIVLGDLARNTYSENANDGDLMVPYLVDVSVKVSISPQVDKQSKTSVNTLLQTSDWPARTDLLNTNKNSWSRNVSLQQSGQNVSQLTLRSGKELVATALISAAP